MAGCGWWLTVSSLARRATNQNAAPGCPRSFAATAANERGDQTRYGRLCLRITAENRWKLMDR
jgi:hypothetical protein